MLDWNGDGNHDWRDDAVYYYMTSESAKDDSSSAGRKITSSGGVVNAVCILFCCFVFLTGWVNGFTTLLCLGCFVRLVHSFFVSL